MTAEREAPPARGPEPTPAPEVPDWRTQRWGTYISKSHGVLPGSHLTGITDFDLGWRATVQLKRGQHWTEVTDKTDRIASVYDLPDGRVLPERIEGAPVHKARLTVLTQNPQERITYWPGPGLNPGAGTFPVAVTADGNTLPYRLWWPGAGGCHGLIAGTQGSGKSACLNLILSEVAASDALYPVLIDGNGGMSVPEWLEHVDRTAVSPADALELLRWADQVRAARATHLATVSWTDQQGRKRSGVGSIDPSPDMPGIVIVIDEAQLLLNDPTYGRAILELVKQLTQMGRKTAVSVVLVTQQPSIAELGGRNAGVLRNMLKSDNVISFRTAERSASGMVVNTPPPEPLNQLPQQWPDGSPTKGLCYVLTQRHIRARTWLNNDPYAYAELLPGKQLDTLSAAVPPPSAASTDQARHSGDSHSDLRVVTTGPAGDTDAAGRVQQAIESGVPPDPASLMHATGLSLRAVKQALARLN